MSMETEAMIRELEMEDMCALLESLTQWFEKMESIFHMSNCTVECQVKYASWSLLGSALTWWNSHVKTVGHDAAYGMPWRILMKMMTDKRMLHEESDQVEKYVGGLLDNIQGQNKRRLDNNSSDNNAQQPPFKRQNVARAYFVGPSKKNEYVGTLLLCNKCKFHHNDPCIVKCVNCKRVGHLTRDCRNPLVANNQKTLTCFECGNQGHYRSDCPELKNRNHGNQSGNDESCERVYALGGGETDQDCRILEIITQWKI
ncbi:reverse transcriptase domain-containing protein [Tanacetum coccineum]